MKRFIPSSLLALLVAVIVAAFGGPEAPATLDNATVADDPVAAWTVDAAHSSVGFSVRHLGIANVRGTFSSYDVDLQFDPSDLSTLATTASIQVETIDTRNQRRDEHLRSDDFFNVEAFPAMRFESTGVQNIDGDAFEIVGNLTIKDVTRGVVLAATMNGMAEFMGNEVAALTAETVIDRHDYGLTWNRMTEAGGVVVGSDITITLEIEAAREQV